MITIIATTTNTSKPDYQVASLLISTKQLIN